MAKTIDAYNREMALTPVVIALEQSGVRINDEIFEMQAYWQNKFNKGEEVLYTYGDGTKPGTKMFFNVLRRKGLIDESRLTYTDKGNPQYGREHVERIVNDEVLKSSLVSRSQLQKALGTYINVYAESYKTNNGRFYPYYNQVRNEEDYGTVTGRFSSNLQQLPKIPKSNNVPNLRKCIVPNKGEVLIKRDFSGQELRVAAHYAEGKILEAYRADPNLDVHNFVQGLIRNVIGKDIELPTSNMTPRDVIKMINFLKLYRGGPGTLNEKTGIPLNQCKEIFSIYDRALPEFEALMKDVENMVKGGTRLRTWGGRLYDVEPPKVIQGRKRTFYYKLGNILIQGSSADMTKEAMIRYFNAPNRTGALIMVVHDELVVSVKPECADKEMKILQWAMDDIPGWDVPLRSEGKIGENFGEMTKFEV